MFLQCFQVYLRWLYQACVFHRDCVYVRREDWINYFDLNRLIDPVKTLSLIVLSMD